MKKNSRISQCRLCKSKKLEKLFSLGNLYLSTFVEKKRDNIGRCPLELLYCHGCTLVQLAHTASQELMYSGNYWYKSGLNKIIRDDLKDIARQGIELTGANDGDMIVDIGSNDSTLLRTISNRFIRVGVEPAKNLWKDAEKGIDILIKDFWTYEKFKRAIYERARALAQGENRSLFQRNIRENEQSKKREKTTKLEGLVDRKWLQNDFFCQWKEKVSTSFSDRKKVKEKTNTIGNSSSQKRQQIGQQINQFNGHDKIRTCKVPPKAKIVFAIGMFYDSEDPNQFIGDIKKILASDGLFIAQLMTSKDMLEKNDVGNICHEHIEYYSYESLKILFEQNGLEIFKVEENKINGGSYRLFARHYKSGSIAHPERLNVRSYKDFYKRICKNKEKTMEFLRKASKDRIVYGYGASTKFNTIAQWYGITNKLVQGIADISKDKFGKMTVGTHIPIYPEKEARELNPDYYLVGPYAFRKFFIKNNKRWLAEGGKFVFCTPKFEIYEK